MGRCHGESMHILHAGNSNERLRTQKYLENFNNIQSWSRMFHVRIKPVFRSKGTKGRAPSTLLSSTQNIGNMRVDF